MICASWTKDMLGCLYDGEDHTDCCAAKRIPPICGAICSGDATKIDFRHFRCIQYMPQITNCALAKFGVLTSEPRNFRFSNVGHNIGLLHWDAPLRLSDSVVDYVVHVKRMSPRPERRSHTMTTPRNTYVLEGLDPESTYECYVEARNTHGVGDATPRIVFRTAKKPAMDVPETDSHNVTSCCINADVTPECKRYFLPASKTPVYK